jgi:hypothetical protein
MNTYNKIVTGPIIPDVFKVRKFFHKKIKPVIFFIPVMIRNGLHMCKIGSMAAERHQKRKHAALSEVY